MLRDTMINKVGMRWRALLALLLVAMLGPTAAAGAQGAAGWSPVSGVSQDVILEDVFVVGGDRAWAVGRSVDDRTGYVYRLSLEGGRWRVSEELRTTSGLYAVSATSADEVWAVGADGLLMRRTRDGWRGETLPAATATVRDIQVLGRGEEAWAVGDWATDLGRLPVAMRYRSGSWEQLSVEAPANAGDYFTINALHLSGGGGWAVGSLIWRIGADGLRVETMPNLCGGSFGCANSFSAVRAIDADRAWAAGSYSATCGVCTEKIGLGYREGGAWRNGLEPGGWLAVMPSAPALPDTHSLGGLYFTDANNGLAAGYRAYATGNGDLTAEIFALRYVNGKWSYEQVLSRSDSSPTALFMADAGHALLVGTGGLIMSYGYGPQAEPAGNPAARVPNPNQAGVAYFPETGHTLRGVFRSYWERYGGLEQFGYPITEEYGGGIGAEGGSVVQYFERARFEYHPENAGTRYEVLLGLLGNEVAAGRRGEAQFVYNPNPTNQPGSVYFPQTGHSMAAEFAGYWERYGGLAIYGYPISEAFYEVNQADGKTYLVQYFERNRLEYHPENAGTRYEVLLGLLGNEIARSRGWIR